MMSCWRLGDGIIAGGPSKPGAQTRIGVDAHVTLFFRLLLVMGVASLQVLQDMLLGGVWHLEKQFSVLAPTEFFRMPRDSQAESMPKDMALSMLRFVAIEVGAVDRRRKLSATISTASKAFPLGAYSTMPSRLSSSPSSSVKKSLDMILLPIVSSSSSFEEHPLTDHSSSYWDCHMWRSDDCTTSISAP